MALLIMIDGEKVLSGGMPGLDTMRAWFPDTMNRGNRMGENTASYQLTLWHARDDSSPNPRK